MPYGCLKGGFKPTYRNWNLTKKNIPSSSHPPHPPSLISHTEIRNYNEPEKPTIISDRERKLEILKKRMKKQQEDDKLERIMTSQILINAPRPTPTPVTDSEPEPDQDSSTISSDTLDLKLDLDLDLNSELISDATNQNQTQTQTQRIITPPSEPIIEKQFIKRTVKRKYTLGKSKLYRRVSILIKDKNTRKNVINAHKELKKKNINDVKRYLKEHGLIKTGSNAPNDVIRKIYESSMLTGDVINKNKETLLHNFLNDTSEGSI